MTLPIAALRSNSLADNWSMGFGNSVKGTQGAVSLVKIFHLGNYCYKWMELLDYKFITEKLVLIPKSITLLG